MDENRDLLEEEIRENTEETEHEVRDFGVEDRARTKKMKSELLAFLSLQIAPRVMRVKSERDLVARLAILRDLRRDGPVERLSTLEAQRTVHEIVLIINNYEQALHSALSSRSASTASAAA